MTSIKTAISIREPLFKQVEALASELNISRSRVFVLAVEEFIKKYQNRQILEEINRAYENLPNATEKVHLEKAQKQQRKLVEGEW